LANTTINTDGVGKKSSRNWLSILFFVV